MPLECPLPAPTRSTSSRNRLLEPREPTWPAERVRAARITSPPEVEETPPPVPPSPPPRVSPPTTPKRPRRRAVCSFPLRLGRTGAVLRPRPATRVFRSSSVLEEQRSGVFRMKRDSRGRTLAKSRNIPEESGSPWPGQETSEVRAEPLRPGLLGLEAWDQGLLRSGSWKPGLRESPGCAWSGPGGDWVGLPVSSFSRPPHFSIRVPSPERR